MNKGKGLLRRPLFCLAVLAGALAASAPPDPAKLCAAGEPDAAIAACSTIIGKDGPDHEALAAAFFDRALARHHRSRQRMAIRGGDKAAARDLRGALADYSRAIRLDPGLAVAYVNRGIIRYETGQFAAAVGDYDAAIRLRPDLPEAWNNRSLARHRLGLYEQAKADFDQTIRLEKNLGNALINRELGPLPIAR